MQLFPALPEVVRGMFRRPEALAVCPPGGGPRERGMFLNQTANYGLSQWEATDRILMEDFNSDNSKIDTTLKENADNIAALEAGLTGKGNCQIVYGSYTGNGGYGSGSPCTLTFDGKPIFVFIFPKEREGSHDIHLKLLRGVDYALSLDDNSASTNAVVWTDSGVQWYSISAVYDGEMQLNTSNAQYCYAALLAVDA